MDQLFYNIAGRIVHQIQREKPTTISQVIVRVQRSIKQNRNWFYFKFSVERLSFIFNNFKTEKFKLTFEGWKRPVCHLFGFIPECLAVKICCTSPWDSEVNHEGADFRCFSLFLPHLRTLAQEKRSENCLRFGTGGPSLWLYPLLPQNIIFCPAPTIAAAQKKNFWLSDLLMPSAWACTIAT